MSVRHRALAVLVAAIWGVNFLAIHASLEAFPPFLLAALRWTTLAVPALLFVPRPRIAWRWLLLYGAGFGVAQFAFLYWGMAAGMPTGLASLVLQCSAPFTVLLGVALAGERLTRRRAIGVVVAVAGLAVVGVARGAVAAWFPFLLTVLGGLGWAFGNLAVRRAGPVHPLRLTLWMSVVPPIPLLALSLAVEGPARIAAAFDPDSLTSSTGLWAIAGLAYTVVIATVIGSGTWAWLLGRHPASAVAPFSMLVPVTGIAAAWLVLGERPRGWEWVGAALVVGGVLLGATRSRPSRRPQPPQEGLTGLSERKSPATLMSTSLASVSPMVARTPSSP